MKTLSDNDSEEERDNSNQKSSKEALNRSNKNLSSIKLKKDHSTRPLWIDNNFRIYFESFSEIAKEAQDLLISIAEPITRPRNIHEYKLTEYSLYAASSIGLDTQSILDGLEKLCKSELPSNVVNFIKSSTKSYAKVKLILKANSYWLESRDVSVLRKLLNQDVIQAARVSNQDIVINREKETVFEIPRKIAVKESARGASVPNPEKEAHLLDFFDVEIDENDEFRDVNPDDFNEISGMDEPEVLPDTEELDLNSYLVHSFEVKKDSVEAVKAKCSEMQYPILEEYDFRADKFNAPLDIDLKPKSKLRPYQETCLSKMFGNGRARSGIIVLPCGAGKTLVGITAAATIKKSVLVLCNSSLSVEQWAKEFRHWSTIKDTDLAKFSSESKEKFNRDAGVLISTYTMVTYSKKRSYDAQKMMEFIKSREWGFLLLDEVHVVPADMFKKTLTIVAAHTKLGLTATLVREDEKIHTLNWLIGPKLYEANWMELASHGYIANVQCAEVWCPMATPFFREYLRAKSRKKQLLYVMNPRKIQACQYLINLHEAMGDKIIVFSDNIFALKHYADKLSKPYIYGGTSQAERIRVLQQFRFNPALNTIFLSKIGDTSIDLPEATCLIQISSHYGSRRQEAQRLGRILRPKKGANNKFTAYFYSLVSTDTEEMFYAAKRQQFLVDQGYEFKIITNLADAESAETVYSTLDEQLSLLNTVLLSSDSDLFEEDIDAAASQDDEKEDIIFTRTTTNTLASLSGTDSMAYLEFQKGKRKLY